MNRYTIIADISNHICSLLKKNMTPEPILNEEFIGLAKYIAENNFSFYATALDAMIPTALKIKYQKIVKLNNYELLDDACKEIFKKRKELVFDNLDNDKQKLIFEEIKNNNVIIETKAK